MKLGSGVFLDLFQASHNDGFGTLWENAFIGKFESTYMHQLISNDSTAGSNTRAANTKKTHKIPINFIPKEDANKLNDDELTQRFGGWSLLDFRTDEQGRGNLPDATWSKEDYAGKIEGCRKLICALGNPYQEHHFKTEWAKKYGHLNLGPGADNRKVESTKDFLDLLENFDLHGEDPTKRLRLAREMTYFAIYKVWGKSHPWAVKAEKEIMDALGLSYNGLLATGTSPARKQRGNCVKSVLVRQLSAFTEAARDKFEEYFFERFFARDVFSPALKKIKEQGWVHSTAKFVDAEDYVDIIEYENWDETAQRKARELYEKAARAKYLIKATAQSHGCQALIYFNEHHPERYAIDDLPLPKLQPPAKPIQKQQTLQDWIVERTNKGEVLTKEAVQAYLSENHALSTGTDPKTLPIAGSTSAKVVARETSPGVFEPIKLPSPRNVSPPETDDSDNEDSDLYRPVLTTKAADQFLGNPMELQLGEPLPVNEEGSATASKKRGAPTSRDPNETQPKTKKTHKANNKKKKAKTTPLAQTTNANDKPWDVRVDEFYNKLDQSDDKVKKMIRKDKECKCCGKNHFAVASWSEYGPDYFKKSFLEGIHHPPEKCFCCEGPFTKPEDPNFNGTWCKVTNSNPAWGCLDAFDPEEDKTCVKVACNNCKNMLSSILCQGKRSRRGQRCDLMPGETHDENGNIVAGR